MMTILHVDDFQVYDLVRGSGNMDLTWLSKEYEVRQTSASGLRIRNSISTDPYQRVMLANATSFTGQRSIYYPIGQFLTDNTRITIGQKLVDYAPNGVAI